MTSEQSFFRLSELAEKLGKTEDNLLHMAAAGAFELSVWHKAGDAKVWESDRDPGDHPPSAIEYRPAGLYISADGDALAISLLAQGGKSAKIGLLKDKGSSDIDPVYIKFLDDEKDSHAASRVSRSNLLISQKEVARMEKEAPTSQSGDKNTAPPVNEPARQKTDLIIIGGLLELLLRESKEHGPAKFKSQAKIIDAFHECMGDYHGTSKRTLEDRFAAAKRAINEES